MKVEAIYQRYLFNVIYSLKVHTNPSRFFISGIRSSLVGLRYNETQRRVGGGEMVMVLARNNTSR